MHRRVKHQIFASLPSHHPQHKKNNNSQHIYHKNLIKMSSGHKISPKSNPIMYLKLAADEEDIHKTPLRRHSHNK